MKRTPDCSSNDFSFAFSASASDELTTCAASVNQSVGFGGTSSAKSRVVNARRSSAKNDERRRRLSSAFIALRSSVTGRGCARIEIELHLRRRGVVRHSLEIRLLREAAAGDEARGELQDVRVVRLRRLVETAALDGDAVLRPFELRLQLEEV